MPNLKLLISRISWVTLVFGMLAANAVAANLAGTITYKTATMAKPAPLAQAMVSVYNGQTKAKTVTLSNDNGAYVVTRLNPGSYVVIVQKNGRSLYQGLVTVKDAEVRLDIRL